MSASWDNQEKKEEEEEEERPFKRRRRDDFDGDRDPADILRPTNTGVAIPEGNLSGCISLDDGGMTEPSTRPNPPFRIGHPKVLPLPATSDLRGGFATITIHGVSYREKVKDELVVVIGARQSASGCLQLRLPRANFKTRAPRFVVWISMLRIPFAEESKGDNEQIVYLSKDRNSREGHAAFALGCEKEDGTPHSFLEMELDPSGNYYIGHVHSPIFYGLGVSTQGMKAAANKVKKDSSAPSPSPTRTDPEFDPDAPANPYEELPTDDGPGSLQAAAFRYVFHITITKAGSLRNPPLTRKARPGSNKHAKADRKRGAKAKETKEQEIAMALSTNRQDAPEPPAKSGQKRKRVHSPVSARDPPESESTPVPPSLRAVKSEFPSAMGPPTVGKISHKYQQSLPIHYREKFDFKESCTISTERFIVLGTKDKDVDLDSAAYASMECFWKKPSSTTFAPSPSASLVPVATQVATFANALAVLGSGDHLFLEENGPSFIHRLQMYVEKLPRQMQQQVLKGVRCSATLSSNIGQRFARSALASIESGQFASSALPPVAADDSKLMQLASWFEDQDVAGAMSAVTRCLFSVPEEVQTLDFDVESLMRQTQAREGSSVQFGVSVEDADDDTAKMFLEDAEKYFAIASNSLSSDARRSPSPVPEEGREKSPVPVHEPRPTPTPKSKSKPTPRSSPEPVWGELKVAKDRPREASVALANMAAAAAAAAHGKRAPISDIPASPRTPL